MRHITRVALGGLSALAATTGCDFETSLAPQVALAVVVDTTGVRPHRNDEGYQIEIERFRVAVETFEFTTHGDMHANASLLRSLVDLVVPTAYAHPGHYAGGEIVGELTGNFVLDWQEHGHELGVASLLEAEYSGANFTFGRAEPGPGVAFDDRFIGHTIDIAGKATLDGEAFTFEALIDQDLGRRVVGVPLHLVVDASVDADLGVALHVVQPVAESTVFDGVDFAALDEDGDRHVVIEAGTEAYNRLRNNLQVHDHYEITTS